jgi:hypothetical protein
MTREDKKQNKEHCKGRPLKVRLQCWYFRNKTEIKISLISVIASLLTHLTIVFLSMLLLSLK